MPKSSLFPSEIVDFSVESLFHRHRIRTHVIYNLIVGALVALGGLMPFVQVDVTSQSRGMIRSSVDDNTLLIPASGFVEKVLIRDNAAVHTGDTLLVVRSRQLLDSEEYLLEKRAQISSEITDLKALRTPSAGEHVRFANAKYLEAWKAYREKIHQLCLDRDFHQREYEIATQLFDDQVIASRELEQKEYNLQQRESVLRFERDNQLAVWQAELFQRERDWKELGAELEKLWEEQLRFVLTAPCQFTNCYLI